MIVLPLFAEEISSLIVSSERAVIVPVTDITNSDLDISIFEDIFIIWIEYNLNYSGMISEIAKIIPP